MPRPSLRLSAAETLRRSVSPTTTVPWSGERKPLAIPSNVDFPDPFSPTSAWISPARQSTLTSRSACTGPNALDTPRSVSTAGLAGPGIDIDVWFFCFRFLLWIHLLEQAQRDERRRRGLLRIALDA